MQRVPVRDLNQHTSQVIARVERGERLEITRNGKPVAVIQPPHPEPLAELIESAELRPAEGQLLLLPASVPLAADSAGLDAVIEDRYGSGRW